MKRLGVDFEELDVSDSNVMADLIMRDVYLDSTPALEVKGRVLSSEELFKGDEVDLEALRQVLEGV